MNEVKELVKELRNKKSRDNRELLDRSADMIERLAKELCEKSGCHHKCHDTKDCVVEDEALLLINENKSNNFDVKSNNELFKQALVEGLNRRFDREIEEAKKFEQISENERSRTMTLCEKCLHAEVCAIRDGQDEGDEIAMTYCSDFQGWISVEERLPEMDERCLLSMENRTTKYRWVTIGYYHTNYDEYVTHWMPLPEAPKMKGGE